MLPQSNTSAACWMSLLVDELAGTTKAAKLTIPSIDEEIKPYRAESHILPSTGPSSKIFMDLP